MANAPKVIRRGGRWYVDSGSVSYGPYSLIEAMTKKRELNDNVDRDFEANVSNIKESA